MKTWIALAGPEGFKLVMTTCHCIDKAAYEKARKKSR